MTRLHNARYEVGDWIAKGRGETVSEDKGALLQHYTDMRAGLLAAIDDLSDAQLTDPSIDGWSVKTHLVHLATWDELRASDVERISAGHDSAWRMTPDQEPAFGTIISALRDGFSLEQARWELDSSHRRLLDAISRATPRGLEASLYGEAALHSTHEAQHTAWIKRWRQEKRI